MTEVWRPADTDSDKLPQIASFFSFVFILLSFFVVVDPGRARWWVPTISSSSFTDTGTRIIRRNTYDTTFLMTCPDCLLSGRLSIVPTKHYGTLRILAEDVYNYGGVFVISFSLSTPLIIRVLEEVIQI